MSALKLTGRLIEVMPTITAVSKAGKSYTTGGFVIETDGQYPKQLASTLFGDKTNMTDGIGLGAILEVSFNLESRQHEGRWYTKASAWRISQVGQAQKNDYGMDAPNPNIAAQANQAQQPPSDEPVDDLPF